MNLSPTKAALFLAIALIFVVIILSVLGVIPIFKSKNNNGGTGVNAKKTVLNVWGVDDPKNFASLISDYGGANPAIQVVYKQIDSKNYESSLLNALATDTGPDIFMFHRSWMATHGNIIVPAPQTQFSLQQLRQDFPDVVEKDFTYNQYVYALPLYLDSLALYYNKDIFNSKSIAIPPTTWDDVKNLTPYLTQFDANHQITKSAITLGGSSNSINTAPDLLTLLMLQFKSSLVDSTGKVSFDSNAINAFNFYLQFASPSSQYYTWSDGLGDSLDSFASGNAAMIIDYAQAAKTIKQKSPFLNFAVTPLPQMDLSKPINYADYWGLAVSTKSSHPTEAWNFIVAATTDAHFSQDYLTAANLPPANRVLINQYLNDPNLSPFARQALSSASIYELNPDLFSQSLSHAIEMVLNGKSNSSNALYQAEASINGN